MILSGAHSRGCQRPAYSRKAITMHLPSCLLASSASCWISGHGPTLQERRLGERLQQQHLLPAAQHSSSAWIDHCRSWESAMAPKSANGKVNSRYASKAQMAPQTRYTVSMLHSLRGPARISQRYLVSGVSRPSKELSRPKTARRCCHCRALEATRSSGRQELSISGCGMPHLAIWLYH